MSTPDPAVSLEEIKERAMSLRIEDLDRAVPAVREALEDPRSPVDYHAACVAEAALKTYHPIYRADVSRLVAAVERILELHRPEMFDGRDADGQEFGSYECITCDNGGLRDNWPCGTYLTITSALTGEAP